MTLARGRITEFQGLERWLSNFWPAVIVVGDVAFPSVEHAYQALKFPANVWPEFAALPATHQGAAKAKSMGRGISYNSQEQKLTVMLDLVRRKFSPRNSNLCVQLLETGDAVLEEGNRWRDTFWGIYPPGSGSGRNELGRIIMQVREEIRQCALSQE